MTTAIATLPSARCDHIVGWLHRYDRGRDVKADTERLSPRLVRQSEVDDIVSAYRAELAHSGASYRRTYAISDEMMFALATYHFRYCPVCGTQLLPKPT